MKLVACLDGGIAPFVAAARVQQLGFMIRIGVFVHHKECTDCIERQCAVMQTERLDIPFWHLPLPLRAKSKYIPHKSLIVASTIAYLAGSGYDGLIFGWHAQGGPYADTTLEFQRALARVLTISDDSPWTVHAPLLRYAIKEVVHIGRDTIGLPLAEMTWSCYNSSDVHCGVCPGCLSRQKGFDIDDPTEYQNKGGTK